MRRTLTLLLALPLAGSAAGGAARSGHPARSTSTTTTSSSSLADPSGPGILNATADCGVDASGTVDVTAPLQRCIFDAFAQNLALFLPPGRYLVSDTLLANQTKTTWGVDNSGTNTWPSRFRPNVLLGSTSALPQRPVLVLRRGSKGFHNASVPKNVLKVTNMACYGENDNMNQVVRGIDFEVQPDNPGAVALYFHGAQGATIQDTTIRLAPDSFAGIGGGPGAGGSCINVVVQGGQTGIWFAASEGAPVISGASLLGQSESALVFTSQAPLVLTGVRIVQAAGATAPAISASASISIIDAEIVCATSDAPSQQRHQGGGSGGSKRVAILSSASVDAKDVYVRGCDTLIDSPATAAALYLEPCNATDPTQQFHGDALQHPGIGVSTLSNDAAGAGLMRCVQADSHGCQNPVCMGPCGGNGSSAAQFRYNRDLEELTLAGPGQTKCLDSNGGVGPDIDFYTCHNASHADQANQRFLIQNGQLHSRSALGQCVAVRSAPGRQHPPLVPLRGGGGYTHLVEVARGVNVDYRIMDVIFVDGNRYGQSAGASICETAETTVGPPADLLTRHIGWNESSFPSFESATTADAVRDCGAVGDGRHDDTVALQRCVDTHGDIFLPKGFYRLSRTLQLRPATRLVGLSETHSVLMPVSDGLLHADPAGEARNGTASAAVVQTARGHSVTLAFVGMVTWWHLPTVFTLDWRAKGGLWRNNYETRVCECLFLTNYRNQTVDPPCKPAIDIVVPKTRISGTGQFYNYVSDVDILFTSHRHYRHVLVTNNSLDPSDRLRFYVSPLQKVVFQRAAAVIIHCSLFD